MGRTERLQPLQQLVGLFRIFFEMRAAGVSDLVRLARTFARCLFDQAHFLKHRQRRVNDARTWRIAATGQLLDGANEVITVPWLLRDQLEQHEPQFAGFEHPARSAAPPAPAFVAEVEVERSPIPLPAAPSAHGHQSFRQIDFETAARAASVMPMSHLYLLSMLLRYILALSPASPLVHFSAFAL